MTRGPSLPLHSVPPNPTYGLRPRPRSHREGTHPNAADRAQGTTIPRRPLALHRRRRPTHDLLRYNTTDTAITVLELRHRQRARAEDRIRAARATGLRNPSLHEAAQNQVWLEIVQIALDLLAWMPMLALTGTARSSAEPRLTSSNPVPTTSTTLSGAVEPGAYPARQPGPQPARTPKNRISKPKRARQQTDRASRKIEVDPGVGPAGQEDLPSTVVLRSGITAPSRSGHADRYGALRSAAAPQPQPRLGSRTRPCPHACSESEPEGSSWSPLPDWPQARRRARAGANHRSTTAPSTAMSALPQA